MQERKLSAMNVEGNIVVKVTTGSGMRCAEPRVESPGGGRKMADIYHFQVIIVSFGTFGQMKIYRED